MFKGMAEKKVNKQKKYEVRTDKTNTCRGGEGVSCALQGTEIELRDSGRGHEGRNNKPRTRGPRRSYGLEEGRPRRNEQHKSDKDAKVLKNVQSKPRQEGQEAEKDEATQVLHYR